MERVTRSVLAAFAAGLFSTIAFTGAEAATITVDSLADAVPASGAAGCTLRKAIENANNGVQTHAACAPPGAATNDIVFAVNGIIQLVASGAGTGVLNLTRTVNILGNGTANTIIRGAPNEHVFDNFGGPAMSISWQTLTIANGNASAATGFTNAGAAYIETTTTATMNTVVVTNNIAVSSAGAIDNRGTLTITNSSFTLNSAPGQGGAIRNVGKLTITNSTFSGNTSGEGGAIHHASSTAGSTLDIANSTFSGNSATGGAAGGGAVSVNSDLAATLTYVTIANNSATTGSGGGLRFNPATLGGGSVVISKSIIAGNTAAVAGADCNTTSTAFASQNFNVFGSLSGCTLGVQANDFTGAALLNPLANNGGPTLTLLPLPYSPARGRIPAASCGLGTDQRGAGRPSGTGCDSGAVEATPTVPQAPTIGTATAGIGQASVSFTAPANNGDSPILSYTATSSPGGITASCGAPCSSIVVGGLTGGVSYTFTVTAANVLGSSVASAASNAVLVTSAPGAPTIGVANAGNTQAVVPFTAPANTGGLPITGYTATSNPSGLTGSCVTPCVFIFVNGLANGTAYTFTVTATNAVGTGPASAASNSVTPIGAPNAPVIGTATAGDAQATVTFAPPAFDGGSPITGYAAIASPGGLVGTCTAPCSSITVTGLTNGVVYTFTVAADNAAGGGADSAPSNSVMPTGVPSAPIIGSATSGNAQATIAFSAPATDGGVAITQYTATSSPSGITGACAAPCSLITVAGLANGTAYTFTVTATNALGTGPASAASNSVTPATIPDAPTIGVALPGNQNVFVPFTPGSDGGSPILQYSAILVPGGFTGTCGAGCTSILVIGLTNGTAYTARVQAINALGSSISAPSNSVTPRTVPDPPIIGAATAGNAQATVTFSAPAFDGFSPITLYRASSTPGFFTGTCVAPCSSITVPGLANGTAYTFVIQADNAAGSGGNSASSNSVTPIGTPGAPTIGLATGGNGQASVTFAAPAFDGGTPITSYTATSSPGGFTGACAAPCTSIAVIGLANGTAYTFTVAATNAVGIGAASAASNSVTPATVPGAPTIGTATGGNAQASVTFAAPASNGGSAVTLYTATSSPSGISGGCAAPCTSIIVSGLANGTAYTFTVAATNAVGIGAASTASNSVTPATVPGAPTIGTATGGN
ncbi:MAG TPA: choice-of-anchor Q domain-containing protein, partial [Ktedonobacterales bacterium]|nr:choice-of-anchor Q domain-containing protein [Ktedonobacterales bacterium]